MADPNDDLQAQMDEVNDRIAQLQSQKSQGTAPPDVENLLDTLNQRMRELEGQQAKRPALARRRQPRRTGSTRQRTTK